MENDLICNFKKCRKRLTTFAWVSCNGPINCFVASALVFSYSTVINRVIDIHLDGECRRLAQTRGSLRVK